MPSSSSEGGLGAALVGEKVIMGQLQLTVTKLIGEGELVTCMAVRRLLSDISVVLDWGLEGQSAHNGCFVVYVTSIASSSS